MYEAKNYEGLLGTKGFTNDNLNTHFKLYQGYVTNVNKVVKIMADLLAEDKVATPEYAEVKRRFGWEFNGMRLHELFFGNITKGKSQIKEGSDVHKLIIDNFGSYENWEKDFKATGAMRGVGWAILYYDSQEDRMFNMWINEHEMGHPTGCVPVVVLDVFEHAFFKEYGTARPDYITAFMNVIDWEEVESRL